MKTLHVFMSYCIISFKMQLGKTGWHHKIIDFYLMSVKLVYGDNAYPSNLVVWFILIIYVLGAIWL